MTTHPTPLICAMFFVAGLAAQTPTPHFSVHEWGTFTTVQGSDGVTLLGAHHEEEGLPDFVHGYDKVHKSGYATKGSPVPLLGVTQKMETPVIYFHADTPFRARIAVEFHEGLTSQWYPQVAELLPAQLQKGPPSFDLAEIKASKIVWDVDVVPAWEKVASRAPKVDSKQPWSFAREVDAAGLAVADGRGTGEVERYLFYRGLGRFALPCCVKADRGGLAEFVNSGAEPLASSVVLEVGSDGARYRWLGKIAAKASNACDFGAIPFRPRATVVDEVQGLVAKQMLLPEGLHADEARAMVRTWARSWFSKPGTRVLYVVPRTEVDRILPLRITPQPQQVVRVLLGRIEFFTPELERGLATALHTFAASGFSDHGPLDAERARFDRFLEPALRRVLATCQDPAVKGAARRVLNEYQ